MTTSARERDVWWMIGRATVGTFAKTAFKLKAVSARNVPLSGGALIAYNHISVIDAVFVALPVVDRGRVVHFFALSQDFERPVVGWGLRKIGQIPIRRGLGDWEAIETSAEVLKRGMLAGIAPEGSVGGGTKLGVGQKGAARIALMAGAPVIPAVGHEPALAGVGVQAGGAGEADGRGRLRGTDPSQGRSEAPARRPGAH